ncbi:MAG: type I polyketide synthase [Caldilineaceae bacterium]
MDKTLLNGIAIIGMAGRFPGAANLEQFWHNLRNSVESIRFFSEQELLEMGMETSLLRKRNFVPAAAMVDDIEWFDASFFNYSPHEAAIMDPQHRLLLECAWEALEDGGYNPLHTSGATGIFASCAISTYLDYGTRFANLADGFYPLFIGNAQDYATSRIAYKLNLKGPSITLSTACSSSLVAVHLACQSLLSGESDMALAGGVSIRLSDFPGYFYQEGGTASPDGHCRAFDTEAQGTIFGHGAGLVLLKPLADALNDGDHIYAVIRGTAINNDGADKMGFTAPSIQGQAEVIAEALAIAEVEPDDISYIETHGTGTTVGDPIEIAALSRAFRTSTSRKQFCAIGSVKTNIGHLDVAAGVANLIKTALALKHRWLPASLHFKTPNPKLNLPDSPFYVNALPCEWQTDALPRRAGVSSFGLGGTNAHLILEEAPEAEVIEQAMERPWHLLTLSAQTEQALFEQAKRYHAFLTAYPETDLANVCYTANVGRRHFAYRYALAAESAAQMGERLAALINGDQDPGCCQGHVPADQTAPPLAFLFTGQGSQYAGMGRDLYETQPIFRAALERCDKLLRRHLPYSLLDILYPASPAHAGLIDQTAYTQPALFALEYALAELWRAWGVEPDVVMGHSVGELVAACVAGVFSLEDGLKLIAARGRLMQALPPGEMVSVLLDEERAQALIADMRDKVSLAAVNGPESVVLSGEPEAIQFIVSSLETEGIKYQRLTVSHAFHSPMMEPICEDFLAVARQVHYAPPRKTFISLVRGEPVTHEITNPNYWVRQLRQAVYFQTGMARLCEQGVELFVEIGPQPVLLGLGRRCLPHPMGAWLPTLRKPAASAHLTFTQSNWAPLLESVGELYVRGVVLNWAGFDEAYTRRRLSLPTYPWQRQRYWKETQNSARLAPRPALHPLLDQKLKLPLFQETIFESEFNSQTRPFLRDHLIYEQVVVAGACHVSLLLGAAAQILGQDAAQLENVLFQQALVIPAGESRTVQVILTPEAEFARYSFKLISFTENEEPIIHVTGILSRLLTPSEVVVPVTPPFPDRQRCPKERHQAELYAIAQERQITIGPSFQWIEHLWEGEREAYARLYAPAAAEAVDAYQLYPGLVDSCLQFLTLTAAFDRGETYVPFRIERFHFYRRPNSESLWCHGQLRDEHRTGEQVADIRLFDPTGVLIAEVIGMVARKAPAASLLHMLTKERREWLYELTWQPQVLVPELVSQNGRDHTRDWLIFVDQDGLGAQVANQLRANGEGALLVTPGASFKKITDQQIQINPASPEHYRRLLEEMQCDGKSPCGILYLWSLHHIVGATRHQAEEIPQQALQACERVLHLVQGVTGLGLTPQLWLVTRGGQAVGQPAALQVEQAALWGLGRVIAREHPELSPICLDLDPLGQLAQESQQIVSEVQQRLHTVGAAKHEEQVALRENRRYVARLVQASCRTPEPVSLPAEASYLITGGLGALGLQAARALVEQGARTLVLTGRHGVSTTFQQEAIHALEQAGAQVHVAPADIAQATEVKRLLAECQALAPLRGIIHAAGLLDDGILRKQTDERFRTVMAPKVQGSWHLHTLTLNLPLDFFVCFSSVSALLGAPGQGNYAAANAFMDALAHHRRAAGLPGLAINWGPWAESGMAARLSAREQARWAALGIQPIGPQEGWSLFTRLLGSEQAQIAVLPVTWSRFAEHPDWQIPLLAELMTVAAHQQPPHTPRTSFLQRLAEAPIAEREDLLIAHLQAEVAKVLGIRDLPAREQGFFALGLDSLMAIELKNRLDTTLETSLPATLVFESSNVEEMGKYIGRKVLGWASEKANGAPAVAQEEATQLEVQQLSAAEFEASLAAELAELEALLGGK